MKKGLSILLLFIFLFNVGGYYLVFWGLRFQAQQVLIPRLDAGHYSARETVELKIPVSLPYPIYKHEYERIDGAFEHEGRFFRLVKHKYQNDTVYLVCIRDYRSEELVDTMNDYLENTQPLPSSSGSNKALQFLGKLFTDYYTETLTLLQPDARILNHFFDLRANLFQSPTRSAPSPPPPWL